MAELTKEELPGFIFLMDEIERDIQIAGYRNPSKEILKKGKNKYNNADERTIRRALNLGINLKKGAIVKSDYGRPEVTTINVLTSFYTDQKVKNFSTFLKKYNEAISQHYSENAPKNEIIEIIFKNETVKKTSETDEYTKSVKEMLNEIKGQSLEEFVNFCVEKKLIKLLNAKNTEDVKEKLTLFLEKEEKKSKRKRLFKSIYRSLIKLFPIFIYNRQFYPIDTQKSYEQNILDNFLKSNMEFVDFSENYDDDIDDVDTVNN